MKREEMKDLISLANSDSCYHLIIDCSYCLLNEPSFTFVECCYSAPKRARKVLADYSDEEIFEVLL